MLNDVLQSWKVPARQSKETSWEQLIQCIDLQEDEAKVIPFYRRVSAWAAAAVVALLTVGGFVFSGGSAVEHLASQDSEYVLPDGSKAMAKAGTQIAWNGEWDERNVTMTGEAFFQVKEGEKFTVSTPDGEVSVLGTSFNVYAENDGFRVDCYSGKVSVTRDGEEKIITKGLCVKMRDGSLSEPFEMAQMQPSWMMDGFYYTNANLVRVIKEVEEHFDITVNLSEDLKEREFSGEFSDTGAEATLQLIAKALSLDVKKIEENSYELY